MSDDLDSRQKDIAGFYGKANAHDIFLRIIAWELQRRDPQFAERTRKALDIGLGKIRAEGYPDELNPFALEIDVKMRERIREMLNVVENTDAELKKALVPLGKPRTLRRRFLQWLERGW